MKIAEKKRLESLNWLDQLNAGLLGYTSRGIQ